MSAVATPLLLGACLAGEERLASAEAPDGDFPRVDASVISAIRVRARPELRENSAAVMSVSQPGVLFSINDSGNDAVLFALDTAGNDRGAWVLRGARNVDWEAAALGPCLNGGNAPSARDHGPGAAPQSASDTSARCLYIGDVGDNAASRPTRAIYRVREPRPMDSGLTDTLGAERLSFRYSDRPHDVEALWVGRDGTTWLITKRRLKAPNGTARPALIFSLPASAWEHLDSVATALLVDSIPVVPGSANGRLITDAALSADGKRLAIRTYREVFIFDADPATGRVANAAPTVACDITRLRERQGEGITWLGDQGRLLLTSEGNRSAMHVIECGSPRGPG